MILPAPYFNMGGAQKPIVYWLWEGAGLIRFWGISPDGDFSQKPPKMLTCMS
jgi:hypothetical protein